MIAITPSDVEEVETVQQEGEIGGHSFGRTLVDGRHRKLRPFVIRHSPTSPSKISNSVSFTPCSSMLRRARLKVVMFYYLCGFPRRHTLRARYTRSKHHSRRSILSWPKILALLPLASFIRWRTVSSRALVPLAVASTPLNYSLSLREPRSITSLRVGLYFTNA